jgi:enamine deaminase RidA (YjgF/YER057c/UK114 family)
MASITRLDAGARMSEAVICNGIVWLAGQVATNAAADISGQTRQVLAAVDDLLARAGTSKQNLLMAQIYLADMADFPGMNAVWDEWIATAGKPARATVEAALAKPGWKVEIVITAALADTDGGNA